MTRENWPQCTNLTSPSRRDPFTTVSNIRRWNEAPQAPLQMHPLPRDEIGIVGEWGSKGPGIAHIPGVDHPLMNGADRVLVVRGRAFENALGVTGI